MGLEARQQLTVGSLFSGIGGFDLGFQRAGMRTLWFCEQNTFRREVLAKHWPDVPCYQDVNLIDNPTPVDVICGGFPCQDISLAGKGAGIEGDRSSLWYSLHRVVDQVRPRYVVVENSPALLYRGIDRVLGTLSESGYDAEWDCFPAKAAGAHHERDRIWIVAYLQDSDEARCSRVREAEDACIRSGNVPDADEAGWEGSRKIFDSTLGLKQTWEPEPNVGRVVDGFPTRVDRVAALGDSLVPQIAEFIGRRIVSFDGRHRFLDRHTD